MDEKNFNEEVEGSAEEDVRSADSQFEVMMEWQRNSTFQKRCA